jgi:hypothetical protein
MGQWNSAAIMIQLNVQAQPILGNDAVFMFNERNCSFLPYEAVPIIDVYDGIFETQDQS